MTIKSIIISGGAYLGLSELGAVHSLIKNNFINLKNIESFYTTSVGTIISIIISLQLEWELIYDYFVLRPWYKIIDINIEKIFNIFNTKGLIEQDFFISLLKPLFDYKEIDINITLEEFEKKVGYKFNIFTCCFNNFNLININSDTHSNIKLIDAINMTCSIPVIFKPVTYDNNLYIDGGLIQGYPLSQCLDNYKQNEVVGIRFNFLDNEIKSLEDINVVEFIFKLINKMGRYISKDTYTNIDNEIVIDYNDLNYKDLEKCLSSEEKRIELIEIGIETVNKWIISKSIEKKTIQEVSFQEEVVHSQEEVVHLQEMVSLELNQDEENVLLEKTEEVLQD